MFIYHFIIPGMYTDAKLWARTTEKQGDLVASFLSRNNNQTKTQFSNDKFGIKPGCDKKYFYIFTEFPELRIACYDYRQTKNVYL